MRIGRSILERKRSVASAGRDGRRDGRTQSPEATNQLAGSRQQRNTNLIPVGEPTGSSRTLRKAAPQTRTTIINNETIVNRTESLAGTRLHRYTPLRSSRVVYHDQPHLIGHTYPFHTRYAFRDYYDRLRYRTIWPRYSCLVGYHHGLSFSFRYFHPYYHRRYMFISLGGYWPLSYRHRRYYWYGHHPYHWYGYYPIAREVRTGSYNYYTYNYYNNDTGHVAETDVFENLAEQAAEPDETTLVDVYFEEAVKVFEAGRYDQAVEKFARAMELAPDDMVLPFAYSQALVANGQYSQAAEVLRAALAKVSPEKEGVFYPRGLYAKEETLLAQIDDLAEKADLFSSDADLQLLLGYQLLGLGHADQAVAPLMFASKDMVNANAASVLLQLLEKIKTSNSEAEDAGKSIAPPQSKAVIKGHSARLKGGTFVATLCALGASVGIGHFMRC
ncbi:MAG: tetratricopeptide repeat protein [Planctomycetota bacterium]